MNLIDAIAMEYQHESGVTRNVIERIPDDKLAWKPHDKSMTAGRLASHLTEVQGWTKGTLESDEFVLDDYKAFDAKTKQEILASFDALVAESLTAMKAGVKNEALMKPWKMTMGGKTMLEMPKLQVLRVWVLNHQIHHRGQLSVYLRMLDAPVPSIYGPSADEQG